MIHTRHLLVHGQVQGVGYRLFVAQRAQELGVTGWVRNRRDGVVEAMIQGEAEALDAIIEAARQGPKLSRVSKVAVADGSGVFSEFTILHRD